MRTRRAEAKDADAVAGLFDAYRCFYDRPSDPGRARDPSFSSVAARVHARETGAGSLVLETLTDNRGAQKLYESLGYVCDNDAVKHYVLELPEPPENER